MQLETIKREAGRDNEEMEGWKEGWAREAQDCEEMKKNSLFSSALVVGKDSGKSLVLNFPLE